MKFFLFTDIQRSTRLWADHTDAMAVALAEHNQSIVRLVRDCGGQEIANSGDGIQAAFDDGLAAMAAAVEIQRWLGSHRWSGVGRLHVRIGLHCGVPVRLVTGDYGGPVFNESARLQDAGHGGQVLVSEAMSQALDGALPPGCRLVSLGVQRLRDLAPAEVFQLAHPDLEQDFPPLRGTQSSSVELVGGMSSFHGRADDLGRLAQLSAMPVLTLCGPGGVGKTRLAQAMVGSMAERHQDGVAVVELGSVARDVEVAAAVATSLRIELSTEAGKTDETIGRRVARWLQPKQMLILLDNCEHVIGAVGELIEEVRNTSGEVQFVCTSQHALGLEEEHVYEVGPLQLPTDSSDPTSPAVALFIDRAREVRANYTPDDRELLDVVELCEALDGLPLAIELAAARLVHETVDSILEGVGDLSLETEALFPGRHGSLQSLVRWSYDLLTDEEKLLFGRLWVFPGPFSLEAASSICGRDGQLVGERFRLVLASLVKKSVVIHDPDSMMFRLLAPMRAFARSTMSQSECDLGRQRFVSWYAAWTGRCEKRLRSEHEAVTAAALEAEFANIRAAHRRGLEIGEPAAAARIVAALRVFAVNQFRFEVTVWAEQSLAEPGTPDELRPVLHGLCGVRAWMRGELESAVRHADQAVEIEDRLGLAPSIYARLVRLAVAGYQERFDDGLREFTVAHQEAKRLDDTWWEVEVLVFSSVGMAAQGESDLASSIAISAAKLTKGEDVCPTSRAWSLYALAESVHRDDPQLAVDFLTSAAELARSVHNEWVLGLVLVSLARQQRKLGQQVEAAVTLLDDMERWSRAGNWSEQWRTVREVAQLCSLIGREEDALVLLAAIEGVASVMPMSPLEASAIERLSAELAATRSPDEHLRLQNRGRLLAGVAPETVVDQATQALRSILT